MALEDCGFAIFVRRKHLHFSGVVLLQIFPPIEVEVPTDPRILDHWLISKQSDLSSCKEGWRPKQDKVYLLSDFNQRISAPLPTL